MQALWIRPAVPFGQLPEQLPDLALGICQRGSAFIGNFVHASLVAPGALMMRAQITLLLQTVEHRIHRARAELVTVVSQLLDDSQPEDRGLGGVVQDVQADQNALEVFVGHSQYLTEQCSADRPEHRCPEQPATAATSRTSTPPGPQGPGQSLAGHESHPSTPADREQPAAGRPRPH